MKSDQKKFERNSSPYDNNKNRGRAVPKGQQTNARASLFFCWSFGFVVCMTFGIASYLMISAGHFSSFAPSGGVRAAWGGSENKEENFVTTSGLIKVEVTNLENENPDENTETELYAENMLEDFGPLPKYLSDYQSITLVAGKGKDGKEIPPVEDPEDEHEAPAIIIVQEPESEEPKLVEKTPIFIEHIVKAGETLSDIAADYAGISAQDILRANGLKDANRLAENQLLLIPTNANNIEETLAEVRTRQMRVASANEKLEPIRTKEYVVAQGDSLWSIASSQGIELDTIVGSNAFKSSATLRPGMKLRIPNQDGIYYTLKKGEQIANVIKRYGVSMKNLRLVNDEIDVAKLKAGDEIFLPGARPAGLVEQAAETKKAPAKSEKTAKNTTPAKSQAGDVAVKAAPFRWPLMGRINSPFGWRVHPITKRKDFHTGIDIKGNRGDPIKAAGAGKVAYAGWMGGYGKVVVIEHNNGQSTLYAHCNTLLVGKGETIRSGALIAKVGSTGRATGPHLHFEVRNGNSPVNPIKYLMK